MENSIAYAYLTIRNYCDSEDKKNELNKMISSNFLKELALSDITLHKLDIKLQKYPKPNEYLQTLIFLLTSLICSPNTSISVKFQASESQYWLYEMSRILEDRPKEAISYRSIRYLLTKACKMMDCTKLQMGEYRFKEVMEDLGLDTKLICENHINNFC